MNSLSDYQYQCAYRQQLQEVLDSYQSNFQISVSLGESGPLNAGVFLRKEGTKRAYYRFTVTDEGNLNILPALNYEREQEEINRFNKHIMKKLGLEGEIIIK